MPRGALMIYALFLFHSLARTAQAEGSTWTASRKEAWRQTALDIFYHGYNNYMQFAFPHDELKPVSQQYTDSLGEFGNPDPPQCQQGYGGVALTLIDSLSTLAVVGNSTEFEKGVWWLVHEVSFDVDLKVNVFEANIRLLGGLLSAHLLAAEPTLGLMQQKYDKELLSLAVDLGNRLMPAFTASPTDLPYAWVNLRHGVGPQERRIEETNAAAVGSFTLEMSLLSRLTGNSTYEAAAVAALTQLWSMRSPLGLVGTSIDMTQAVWNNRQGGTGAGIDSFYEYLLKAYVLFGQTAYWEVFQEVYRAAMQHYRSGPWYDDADIVTGQSMHQQFQSLQAFWPGMQVLAGDVLAAQQSYWHYFGLWQLFGALPERFLYPQGHLHPNQQQYPLRPELLESTFYLYQATHDTKYLDAGAAIMDSLYALNWVEGGWASVQSMQSKQLEDHMPSYFLAEACKYLFLLFDDSFLQGGNYIFTTEGHPIPVLKDFHNPQAAPTHLQYLPTQPRVLVPIVPPQTVVLTPDHTHLWHMFKSLKQHFTSSQSEHSQCTAPSTPANEALSDAPSNDAQHIAELGRQLQRKLARDVPSYAAQDAMGPSTPRVAFELKQDGSVSSSGKFSGHHERNADIKHKAFGTNEDIGSSQANSCADEDAPSDSSLCQVPEASKPSLPLIAKPSSKSQMSSSRQDALARRVCPAYGQPTVDVLSLCHLPDQDPVHSCKTAVDCGVDSSSCRPRVCSMHGYCQAG